MYLIAAHIYIYMYASREVKVLAVRDLSLTKARCTNSSELSLFSFLFFICNITVCEEEELYAFFCLGFSEFCCWQWQLTSTTADFPSLKKTNPIILGQDSHCLSSVWYSLLHYLYNDDKFASQQHTGQSSSFFFLFFALIDVCFCFFVWTGQSFVCIFLHWLMLFFVVFLFCFVDRGGRTIHLLMKI